MIMKSIIQKEIIESSVSFYIKHLTIADVLLNLNVTSKEIEVLANFLTLNKNLTEEEMFNSLTKKKVRQNLGLSHAGISNHIRHLIEKNLLYYDNDILKIKEYLRPTEPSQGYKIKLTKE